MELEVWRIPFSTNVERIAIACAVKGVEVRWHDADPADRSEVVALSGQPLLPIARFAPGEPVLADSPRILERLEAEQPDPPLWPRDPAARARADVFAEWFNGVWKGPPNAIAAGDDDPAHAAALARWNGWFEALLADGPHLLGAELTIADVLALPFLRLGLGVPDDDPDPFHHVLHEHLAGMRTGALPRLASWAELLSARFGRL
jgi:glutathione S-transferase